MVTTLEGKRIDADTKYPNKGIVRSMGDQSQCVWVTNVNAYKCEDMPYTMMIIESLDRDTEIRRLSPVALAANGYIDLINGPQDHGWCHGYTCQERISTFNAIVAIGLHYEMFLTSYNPQKTRLKLLNVKETDAITIEIFYPKPQRLDIYRRSMFTLQISFLFRHNKSCTEGLSKFL